MKINIADGSVNFTGGTIARGSDKAAFLASSVGAKAEKWFANDSLETYRVSPESGVLATVDFRNGRLSSVAIGFLFPDDSADGPSMERELRRKRQHDDWLRAELGEPPYQYDWGHIVSAFYQQHCESDIVLAYKS